MNRFQVTIRNDTQDTDESRNFQNDERQENLFHENNIYNTFKH